MGSSEMLEVVEHDERRRGAKGVGEPGRVKPACILGADRGRDRGQDELWIRDRREIDEDGVAQLFRCRQR